MDGHKREPAVELLRGGLADFGSYEIGRLQCAVVFAWGAWMCTP